MNTGTRVLDNNLALALARSCFPDVANLIDATEGGARKKCTERMTLREAIATYATQELDPALFDLSSSEANEEDLQERRERMSEALERRLEEASELATLYRRAIKLLEKVLKINKNGDAADEQVLRVLEIREEIKKHDFLYYLLNSLAQSDLFLRARNDRNIKGDELEGVAKQQRQASRDLDYIRGLAKALEFVESHLKELQSKLRRSGSRQTSEARS